MKFGHRFNRVELDPQTIRRENWGMENNSLISSVTRPEDQPMADLDQIPPELMAELQEAADRAAKGIRDPEIMREACESMDRQREEIRRKHGILDIAVPAIRELRDHE